jgi:hypothetical protein
VPFKFGGFLAGKTDSSKSLRNMCSQTSRLAARGTAAPLSLDAVAEDCTDFIRQFAAVPFGSTSKESLHGTFDVANNDLSER